MGGGGGGGGGSCLLHVHVLHFTHKAADVRRRECTFEWAGSTIPSSVHIYVYTVLYRCNESGSWLIQDM